MKDYPKRRITIFIAAWGAGEIGQGIAFARYALWRGARIIFAVLRREDLSLVPLEVASVTGLVGPEESRLAAIVTATSKSLNRAIASHRPDALILCNSKLFSWDGFYPTHPPSPKPPTISIDSNWLFDPAYRLHALPWVDVYCINLPGKIFKLGLKQYGGHYEISPSVLKKIRVVGLVPSYPKTPTSEVKKIRAQYGVLPGEKLVFLYASVRWRHFKQEVFEKAVEAVRLLQEQGYRIKMVSVGGRDRRKTSNEWFTQIPSIGAMGFYKILASSDLVFQHQGLGTLAQAISARIPAIANVIDVENEEDPRHAHAWEALPFQKTGACSLLYFSTPISAVAQEIETLLYDRRARRAMQRQQAKLYSRGEKAVFEEVLRAIGY